MDNLEPIIAQHGTDDHVKNKAHRKPGSALAHVLNKNGGIKDETNLPINLARPYRQCYNQDANKMF